MKLKKLRLQNYRVHEDSTLDCGDATFIVLRGANGSGKTSFADALSMNLAQTTVSLPTDGKGFVKKITQGETKSIITADIQGQHILRSTMTLNTNTSGRTGTVECLDDPENNKAVTNFKNFLADRKPAILIATSTDYFLRLDEKSQTNLIAQLVLPPRYDFPKDKVEATNSLLDTPINFESEPFDVISKAYKATHKERETVNRQVKEFDIPDPLPIPKGVDSESLNEQLNSIREERSKLLSDRDAAVKQANDIEVKRATLKTKRENLLKKRDEDQKKLTETIAKILSDEDVSSLTKTAGRAEELKNLNLQHSIELGVIRTLGEQINKFKDMSETDGNCPVCEQILDKEKIGVLVADYQKEYTDADRKIQELDTQIEAIGDVQAAKDSLKKHNDAVKEKAEIEKSLLDTVSTGKTTRSELDALPEAVNATLSFNAPLTDLQSREDKINEQLHPVIAAEERKKEIARLTEQLAKLQKKADTLDTLVKFFDKDGIKKTLIGQYVGPFESKINAVMDAFGCKTSLAFDPQVGFEVETSRGYIGPIKELCGAEAEIFKRAFQCAVSIAAGIKMVVLDEMEELGEDIRGHMYGAVLALIQKGDLDQAILIVYSLDKNLPKPQAPGSAYYYVTDGVVEKLR